MQTFEAVVQEAEDTDVVMLVANCHRRIPLNERQPGSSITPNALRILNDQHVVFVTAAELFEIWKQMESDPESGRVRLLELCPQREKSS